MYFPKKGGITISSKDIEKAYQELIELIGPQNVSIRDIDRIAYSRDWSPMYASTTYKADIITIPKSTEDVVRIVKIANKYLIPIVPRGGGTGMTGGCLAITGGIILDMKQMNRVEVDEKNMCVVAQSGATVEKVREECEKLGFLFADNPESRFQSTIGGRIAVDGVGTWGAKYGAVNKQVLGLEVVLPSGEVIRTGGKFWKHSSGPKLAYLFTGSGGWLGIITEAILKMYPLPEKTSVHLIGFRSYEQVLRAVDKMMRKGIWPECLMVNDPTRAKEYSKEHEEGKKEVHQIDYWVLGIAFAGSDEMVRSQVDQARKIFDELEAIEYGPNIAADWWHNKYVLTSNPFPAWQKEWRFATIEPAVPNGKIKELWEYYRELLEKYQFKAFGLALYQDGTVFSPVFSWIIPVKDTDKSTVERYRKFCDDMTRKAIEVGGSVSSQLGVGIRGVEFTKLEHTTVSNDYDLIMRIKRLLDPNNIMNPGKFTVES
jgi:glycolate oxidase